jgi:hypothetical protein
VVTNRALPAAKINQFQFLHNGHNLLQTGDDDDNRQTLRVAKLSGIIIIITLIVCNFFAGAKINRG